MRGAEATSLAVAEGKAGQGGQGRAGRAGQGRAGRAGTGWCE